MREAEAVARANGVRHLYVHVVTTNAPAVELYRGAGGFDTEAEESEGVARSLGRPKRYLLHKELS